MISFQSWIKSCTHFYIFAVSPTVVYSIQVSAVQPYSNKKTGVNDMFQVYTLWIRVNGNLLTVEKLLPFTFEIEIC